MANTMNNGESLGVALIALLSAMKERLRLQRESPLLRDAAFNVFEACHCAHTEAVHSRFLGALLTPNGCHGLGDQPLRLFLKGIGDKTNLQIEYASVVCEYADNRAKNDPTSEETRGNRLDLFITDGVTRIGVEVKIGAYDQERQLSRYREVVGKEPQNALYYLTLEGREPSERDAHAIPVSFKHHIRTWIGQLIHLAAEMPRLRETLRQYLDLLTLLTETTMEYADLLFKDAESYKAAKAIVSHFPEAERLRLTCELQRVFREGFGVKRLDVQVEVSDITGRFGGLFIGMPNEEEVWLAYEFQDSGFRDPCLGLKWKKEALSCEEKHIKDGWRQSPWWPLWKWGVMGNTAYSEDVWPSMVLFDKEKCTDWANKVIQELLSAYELYKRELCK